MKWERKENVKGKQKKQSSKNFCVLVLTYIRQLRERN
jgi:hypothetical protein